MKERKILVTGGAGFVGSHLVDALIDRAEQVVVIDKVDPKASNKNEKAEYIKMNIQADEIQAVFEKYQPDVVFHLAAHLHDRESVEMPIENAKDNVLGLLNICEANRRTSRAKIVFMSSCAVYGNQTILPITEEMAPSPQTPYGITKLVGENYLRFYQALRDIPFVAFRSANIYGPRQDSSAESGVIGIFSSRFIKGEPVVINNDGQTTRDYIYVSDVVSALIKASELDVVGVFNLGTGLQTSTQEIFNMVKVAVVDVGARFASPVKIDPNQQDALKHICLSAGQAQKAFDWMPEIGLEEGIKKTVAWYRENTQI